MKLTSHERIMRLFQNKEVDRPALKLWGAVLPEEINHLHPAYDPVGRLAANTSDLFGHCGFSFDMYAGKNREKYTETWYTDTKEPTRKDLHTVFHTPKGDLHSVDRISTVGEPSYTMEYMIKEPTDIEKLLSMTYEPYPVDRKEYDASAARMGDRGVVMIGLDHAAYAMERLMGSETLAYFSVDCREELHHLTKVFSHRLTEHVKNILDTGIEAPFSWVGPELFLPPLLGPKDFQDFVYQYDKPLCDLIHEGNGYVWVHSHGKVADFIQSFIDMGVDILNPLEPPKNGDIHFETIVKRFGNQIGWEGNIEIQELLLSEPERIRALIDECVQYASESGRFILCPSAGYNEYPFPTEKYIENLLLYLTYGLEAVERYRI